LLNFLFRTLDNLFNNNLLVLGGWNNNHSVVASQYIFRRLVTRCGVEPSTAGNVKVLDATTSLLASSTYLSLLGKEDHEDIFFDDLFKPPENLKASSGPILGCYTRVRSGSTEWPTAN